MTRGKQILEEAKRIIAEAHERGSNDPMVDLAVTLSFSLGARWADKNPRWISVKDELPMELEPVLAAFGNHYARVCFYNGGKWYIDAGVMSDEAFGVSHWIQIPPPPKKGGDQ